MARPKRSKLEFGSEESLNKLLQEVYNESQNIRAQTTTLFNQWNKGVKENGEIAAVGDKIAKLLTILSKTQDQKIVILKHLKDSVYIDVKKSGDASNVVPVGDLDKNGKDELDAMVEKIKAQVKKSNN